MSIDSHTNFAYGLVTVAPSPNAQTGLTLSVSSATGALMPTVPFNATVWPAEAQPTKANAEIVRVTANAAGALTIVRSQEGTTARVILVGDQFAASITAKTMQDVESAIAAETARAEAAESSEATTRSTNDGRSLICDHDGDLACAGS